MATIKPSYGTTKQAFTITLNSLASSATAGRQSTVVDNRTNLYMDALVQLAFQIATGGTAANDKAIYIYVFGTVNDTDNSFGAERGVAGTQATIGTSDAAYSMTDPTVGGTPLVLAKVLSIPLAPTTTAGVYQTEPFSVAACFGGVLPAQWGIFVRNYTGQTLDSSGNSAWYQGVQYTVA